MKHVPQLPFYGDRFDNILLHKRKARVVLQMQQVVPAPGNKIVHRNHVQPFGQQAITKMRTEESGSSGNKRARHTGFLSLIVCRFHGSRHHQRGQTEYSRRQLRSQ